MIRIPNDVYNDIFEGELKRGTVIKTLLLSSDGKQRYHYFIVLSYTFNKDPLIFVTATSKLDFYNNHPTFNKDIIRIGANQLSYFPLDTVIDCRKIYKFNKDILKNRYRSNILKFIGVFPNDRLKEIDIIVQQSKFISKNDKILILGDNYDKDNLSRTV